MSTQAAAARPIETLSFEEAMSELDGIVRALESGAAPLEQSIESYERGIALKNHCAQKLADAQAKIEKINIRQDGTATTSPLDGQ